MTLRRRLRRPSGPQILAGDFNFWGPPRRRVLPGGSARCAAAPIPRTDPHSQIDHVLVRGGIEVLGGEVLAADAVGSPPDPSPAAADRRSTVKRHVRAADIECRAHAGEAHDRARRGSPPVRALSRGSSQYRELLVGMVRKELKIKYKNSVLGFAWSLLNPLLYLVVFYIAFTKILGRAFPRSRSGCCRACSCGTCSRPASAPRPVRSSPTPGWSRRSSFPREILPLAAVGSMLVHFFLQSMVLFAVLAIVRWDVAWAYIPLLPLALVALLLAHGRARDPALARSTSTCATRSTSSSSRCSRGSG